MVTSLNSVRIRAEAEREYPVSMCIAIEIEILYTIEMVHNILSTAKLMVFCFDIFDVKKIADSSYWKSGD